VLQYFHLHPPEPARVWPTRRSKTADSGYLTPPPGGRRSGRHHQRNRLRHGGTAFTVEPITEAESKSSRCATRVVGRVSLDKIKDYEGNVIVDVNQEISEELANAIQGAGPSSAFKISLPC